MKLLDLFCGAGGAAMGYHRAGFDEIIGVDIQQQPRYPFRFVRGDALQVLGWMAKYDGRFPIDWPDGRREWLGPFDAIHASPPCQKHTQCSNRWRGKGTYADSHQDLLSPTIERLEKLNLPFVVENVVGARRLLPTAVVVHGGMFNLGVHRPRLFATSFPVSVHTAPRSLNTIGVYGKMDGRRLHNDQPRRRAARTLDEGQHAMGIDWMQWPELVESIPPAYTEYIGRQLLQHLTAFQPQQRRA